MEINLYDFDETIYDGDSSVDFIFYSLKKYPKCFKMIPKAFIGLIKYKMGKITKTEMKVQIFSFVKYIPNIDKEVEMFWEKNEHKIKKFYLEKDHSKDIIISASPEFLLKPITKKLKVKDMMASRVDKKTGEFDGLNCHDTEKVRRLNEKYKNYKVIESYSDSKSDIPILELAETAYYVKGNKLTVAKF